MVADPVYDEEHEAYEYRVEGTTIDDDSAVAITVFVDRRSILALTIF